MIKENIKKVLILFGYITYYLFRRKLSHKQVFIFPYYHIGGAERVHLDIVQSVQELDPLVVFACKSEDQHFLHEFSKICKLVDLSNFGDIRIIRLFLSGYFANMINHSNVSTIFGSNNLFYYEMLPFIKKRIKKIDLMHAFGSGIETDSLVAIPYLAKRIIIDMKTQENLIQQYQDNSIDDCYLNRIELIENMTQIGKNDKEYFDTLNIIYVGRGAPEKRVHLIGKIAKQCSLKKLNVIFTCVGDVVDAIDSEDQHYCKLVGKIKNVNLYYEKAHILVMSSEREGFPLVIMEGMANGVVPIVTDVGGIKSHVHHMQNGVLIENNDEQEIVDKIVDNIQLLDQDRQRCHSLSVNAFEYAKKHFSPEIFKTKYLKLLN